MDYRFEISLPTSSDFRCEIAVGGEQTFQQFHDKIVETLNYDSSQMASFFTLDRMGNRVKEIALMDMTTEDEENETLVMDNTKISDIIKPGCLELEYVYDFFSNKYFKVEYAGEYIRDSSDVMPVCVACGGIFRNNSLTRMGMLIGSLTSRRKSTRGIMTIVSWKSSAMGIMTTRIAKTGVVMMSTIVTNATRVWMII
ncbi:MAG: hypothetical protein V8R91_00875 [Butyricimonas faecihominis]